MSDDFELEEQRLLRRKKKSSEAGNLQQLAETCRKLGELYVDRGEHLKALNEFKLVAKAFNNLKMPMEVGRANRLVGEQFMELGEHSKALQYEKVYLDIARRENDKVELQRAYATIGRTYLTQGQSSDEPEEVKESLWEAEKAFVKGLKLCRELKQVGKLEQADMEARAILNLGVTKEHQGKLDEAIEFMQKATEIAQNNELQELVHICLMTTASLYNGKLNNQAKALKVLSDALEVASRFGNKAKKMCETLVVKADALIKMGDFQSAKQALTKAHRLKTPVVAEAEIIEQNLRILVVICRAEDELITIDSSDHAKKKLLYEKMGDAACKLSSFEKAIDYYLKTLECAQQNDEKDQQLLPIYVSLYQTYKDNKQYEEALKYIWKEYNLIKEDPKEAYNTLLTVGEVYEAQNRSHFEIDDMYRRVRFEAMKLQSLSLQRAPLKRCIAVLKKNSMDLMAENLEKEASDLGIDLTLPDDSNLTDDSDDEQDEAETNTVNTPDIGADVDLDELTEPEDDVSGKQVEKQPESRASRKRGVSFQIKRNNKGETQLHQACINANTVLVQKLLEQGHPVNLRDHAGWLPLHEACNKGDKEIVEMLLDRGAHINDRGGTSCDGITPLYDACSNGNLEVVELLLDRGANCTLRTDSGDTTLNVLETWFKSVQKKLSDENIVFYNAIRDRITSCFDKAGIKLTDGGTIPESIELDQSTPNRGPTRSTRRRPNRLGRSDSDSDHHETQTIASTIRSSGYGSVKTPSQPSSRKRPPDIQSDSSCLSSDGEEEPKSGPSRSSLREKSARRSAGVDDYRNAIQVLRKGNGVRAQIVSPLKDPNPGPSKRSAFLRNDEIGDDWLIDDLGPNKKRQKFHSENDYYEPKKPTPKKRSNDRESSPPEALPISDRTITSTALDFDSDSDDPELEIFPLTGRTRRASSEDPDAHQVLMNASGRSFTRRPSTQSKSSRRLSVGSFTRNQTSLLEAGFNVSSSVRSLSPPPLMAMSSPAKSSIGQRSPEKRTPVKILPPNVVRVLVEDEPVDIICDAERMMELSVGWLMDEVTKRYGLKHGKRPLLKLLRPDEGLCVETDPLTTLLNGSNFIVNSYLIELKQMRADEYYKEYCKQHDVDLISDLLDALTNMHISKQFTLCRDDFHLKMRHQRDILLQALATQEDLREINLSWNKFTDNDLSELAQKLPSFSHLEVLNLSMNRITHKGVSFLLTLNPDSLSVLTELNLSRNILLDQSLPLLTVLCQRLKQLKVLRLVSTSITNLTFTEPSLDISQLQVFDVSENKLNNKSIDYLFTKINTRIITELNLRKLGKLPNFKPTLMAAVQTNDFDMLGVLNLSHCALTDCDLSVIVCSLSKTAEKLKSLNVSGNAKLTRQSLIEVLKGFTGRSLEVCCFLQNPLILKDFNGEDTIRAIEYDPEKSYPYELELMPPLRVSGEKLEDLRHQLKVFWDKLCQNSGVIKEMKGMVKLSSLL